MRLFPLILLSLAFGSSIFLFFQGAEAAADPYKVLGVERNASQREIQKAFHKLSLKYHPDKNKAKGAQERFAEINNAYEILSDEEKRKNYDLYGDEKGAPRFESTNHGGDHDGYTYFTTGGSGSSQFSFRPGGQWQRMHSQKESFPFSFGGDSTASGSSFSFGGLGDVFSSIFGGNMKGGDMFGGFDRSGGKKASNIQKITTRVFNNEVLDQSLTWLLLFYNPSVKGYHVMESMVQEVASSLQGALKAGSVNCQAEQNLCRDLGIPHLKSARVFIYSYKTSEKGTLIEYNGELDAKELKTFCQDQLPRFSNRVNLGRFDFSSGNSENLPQVLLLSTKKDTPVIWRALSGLYHKRLSFYDAQVSSTEDPIVKSLGVDALPAVVGWLLNGEKQVLKTGPVKDLRSGINELKSLLDNFEKKNKRITRNQWKRASTTESEGKTVIELTSSNIDSICGKKTAVCIIGLYRSSGAKKKLESILSNVSQKTLTRSKNQAYGSKEAVSYSLLDASKQPGFVNSLDKSGFKALDKFLVAYKPNKDKFAVFKDEFTMEEVEKFISSVLNGDIRFTRTRQRPVLK